MVRYRSLSLKAVHFYVKLLQVLHRNIVEDGWSANENVRRGLGELINDCLRDAAGVARPCRLRVGQDMFY